MSGYYSTNSRIRLINHRLPGNGMDEYKPCERCGDIRILDGAHRICFDCFIELDLEFHEKELLKELEESE